ncbi:hypothetical protein COCNU_scaffold001966G000010 [Cocos nucifera]|nr:hypothetical protein [Cocos nucifera]
MASSKPLKWSCSFSVFFFSFFFLALQVRGAAKTVPVVGNISKVDDAQLFHIYYGQSFKVIKNSIDGKSYLLMQLLGLLDSLKGITSDEVTSQCILKSLTSGNIQLVNRTDIQQLLQFSAHFISNVDAEQACNFAAFVPMDESTPLQVKANYICLSKSAANLKSRFKPVVAWVEYNQGIWSFAKEVYKLQYVTDAGGENVDGTITSNLYNVSDPEDMENFHAILCTVDVVIDQTYALKPAEYTLSTFLENMDIGDSSCFGFITNQSLWRYDKRMRDFASLDV